MQQQAMELNPNAKDMFLNLLCYLLIEVFDVMGVMHFLERYLPFDDPDLYDPNDWDIY